MIVTVTSVLPSSLTEPVLLGVRYRENVKVNVDSLERDVEFDNVTTRDRVASWVPEADDSNV